MSFENDDDDGCWDVINDIINNTDCIQKMCDKTAWFKRKSEFKLNKSWGDVVKYDCGEIFWAVSGTNLSESGLKEGNCDICESDCTHLTGCGDCNALRLSCCKDWCAETDCVCVIEVLKWSDENCKKS